MKKILLVSVCLLFLCSLLSAEEKKGAKALFDSGEGTRFATGKMENNKVASKKPVTEKYMGIAYWIDLKTKDGKLLRTTSKREFRSGEKIKLNLKSNRDGYLYVINVGSTGSSRILFPHSAHLDNFIKANETYAVPFNTFMLFDENPGEETLLVLLSPQEVKELFPSTPNVKTNEADQVIAFAGNKGAKDILLEDDHSAKSTPAQYAVAPMSELEDGAAISLFIKLKHK